MQFSTGLDIVRANVSPQTPEARLDVIQETIGGNALLKIYSGSIPASCAVVAPRSALLARIQLPSVWMSAAEGLIAGVSGIAEMTGIWQEPTVDGTGIAGYFRIYSHPEQTCYIQGTVGFGNDLELDSLDFVAGQDFQVTQFSITDCGLDDVIMFA